MGCHGGIGVTVDGSFSLPRKLPGEKGWGRQDLAGIQDVPEVGSNEPETLRYFRRAQGGDEFRANGEMLDRFFPGGKLDEDLARRAAAKGPEDIRYLILPSRTRALLLDKAYMSQVHEQHYELGRDATIAPVEHVYQKIEADRTGLDESGHVWRDGRLWLDWGVNGTDASKLVFSSNGDSTQATTQAR